MNNSRMIDKNAHVNVIYSLEQVNYISFGVGYCLLLVQGSREPHSGNTQ